MKTIPAAPSDPLADLDERYPRGLPNPPGLERALLSLYETIDALRALDRRYRGRCPETRYMLWTAEDLAGRLDCVTAPFPGKRAAIGLPSLLGT